MVRGRLSQSGLAGEQLEQLFVRNPRRMLSGSA
jgi:hypothetical protein